jgi:hypothetical protein
VGAKATRWARKDDSLPHQIRLFWTRVKGTHTAVIGVGCNCRPNRFGQFDALGIISETESPWPVYNDPANHNNDPVPFDESMHGGKTRWRE